VPRSSRAARMPRQRTVKCRWRNFLTSGLRCTSPALQGNIRPFDARRSTELSRVETRTRHGAAPTHGLAARAHHGTQSRRAVVLKSDS
jgi:hypothetical protein